jgi:multidrug efflux pump subunit AcrB
VSEPNPSRRREPAFYEGPLAWMAQNSVASNLLMFILLIGGALMLGRLKQEVFPEIELDSVSVTAVYPGASPSEVEQGVVLAVEEAVRGVDGVKEVTSRASEGSASVTADLLLSADKDQALADIKSAVDRITSFPDDVERPNVALISARREVISIVLSGDTDEKTLKGLAEQMREELLVDPNITVVEIDGVRAPEISIEIPKENLRRYGLTLQQVAQAVGAASVELPGGGVDTDKGEVLLRVSERRETADGFSRIVVLSRPDGTQVTVGDLGTVTDGFADVDRSAFFNGERAARVTVFRVGEQTPIEVAGSVKDYVEDVEGQLPPGISASIWNDRSEIYADRISLLLRNAFSGLILVLLLLGLFLEIKLAFWVTLGIPISFLGAILMMPAIDVSLNMISLFAFILTLGIVVDDAIVVGEAIYKQRQDGHGVLEAAIMGVREVAQPVVFSVLTTVVAFSPLLFVPGVSGKFFRNIPMIVIPILLISLVESLLVLPAHLSHGKPPSQRGLLGAVNRGQKWIADKLEVFVERVYTPVIRAALRQRYLTLATALGILIMTVGLVVGGKVKSAFFPKVEGDTINVTLELPFGSPVEDTERLARVLEQEAMATLEANGGAEISRGIYRLVGSAGGGGGALSGGPSTGSHKAQVSIFLVPADERGVTTAQFTEQWRARVGELAGVETLRFSYDIGPGGGQAPIEVRLNHPDLEVLEAASSRLAEELGQLEGVFDIDDGFTEGKEQLDLVLKPSARSLGLSQRDLASQVRASFFGAEAARQQRGRDELRVYVRLPESERVSEYDIEQLNIRTADGGDLPLTQAADIVRGRSYTQISRVDGRRVVSVTCDLDSNTTSEAQVRDALTKELLPKLMDDVQGLRWGYGGQQADRQESNAALGQGFLFAMLVMFTLMAVAFRSYVQPIIVMGAIPFGVVGAVLGHLFMGYELSLISVMGIVALSGVVVNDSLVLVDAINGYRARGVPLMEAVVAGGARRFRPIMLTTLTTFFGLMPMILETSVQARFLIPMAISLGCGILFVTFIALLLVPTMYIVLEDVTKAFAWVKGLYVSPAPDTSPAPEAPAGVDGLDGEVDGAE